MDIFKNKIMVTWVVAGLFFLALTYLPMFMNAEVVDTFTKEDRIYETLSPLYLFVTAIGFFIAFLQSKIPVNFRNPKWIRRMIFLGLGILFFVAAGEEISWGQRIFGFEPPNLIKERNIQKEFTIHNLDFIQGEDRLLPFSFGQMAAMFALTCGALIPLASHFLPQLGRRLEPIFPVLPVLGSILFIGNYLIQKIIVRTIPIFPHLYQSSTQGFREALLETREHGYEFSLMIATILYVFVKLRAPAEQPVGAGEAEAAMAVDKPKLSRGEQGG
jgi:hypothetical protein